MNTDVWNRIKRVFHEALELPCEEREAFLDRACTGDDVLRAEVETLLSAHDESGDLLQSPTATANADGVALEVVGSTIGRYKLLQQIGEGGFGSVYMAEQEKPVRRKVALKVIKLGMDTKQVIARFEAERQALALMDHPNIARVLDAGATETGRPYFVMELVRGIPITEYCDQNNLTTRERLELFQSVCSAVQHAHQKGIIHRDIKPSNVMVTLHDGVPVAKVIDFGIAKATNQKLTEKTLFTEYHQFIGTPQYMSPEQAEMSGLDVDTRTDIYALGVLLYELLTGTTPFDARRLRSLAFTEIHRVIREEEPDKPSTRLSTLGDAATETAKRRATDLATLRRSLSGDLDWIVMKAIEKDRTRRYDTANSLRLDVERHLENEPVLASPPGTAYRVRKFLRRNRAAVAVCGTVAVALLLGIGLATFGFLEARRERVVARAEADAARAINDFFTDMLASVDPAQNRLHSSWAPEHGTFTATRGNFDQKMSVAEMLLRAGERVEEIFRGQPALEAEVRETVAVALYGLGRQEAGPHLQKAWEIRRDILAEDHPDRLRTELMMAIGSFDSDRIRDVRDAFERVYGADHPKTLSATTFLARALTVDRDLPSGSTEGPSKFQLAGELYRQTLEKQREKLGDEHRDVIATLLALAEWHEWSARGSEAEPLAREAYETAGRILSPDDALTLSAASNLGWALNFQGRHEEAEKYLREVMAKQKRIYGDDHPGSAPVMAGLARALHRPEDLDEKEDLWRRAVELNGGPAARLAWVPTRDLARFLVRRGKADEGVQFIRQSYEAYLDQEGEQNSFTTGAERNLLALLWAAGRDEEARDHLKAKLDELRRRAEEEDATASDLNSYAWRLLTVWPTDLRRPRTAIPFAVKAVERVAPEDSDGSLDTLARARSMTGDLLGAVAAQRQAVEVRRSRDGADAGNLVVSLVRYLTLAEDRSAAIEETKRQIRLTSEELGAEPTELAETLGEFGRRLSKEGLWAPAELALLEARTQYDETSTADPDDRLDLLVELAKAYLGQERLAEAEPLLARVEELSLEVQGATSADHANPLSEIALGLSNHGHDREAVPFLRRAVEIYARLGDEKIWERRFVERGLALTLARLGQTEEARRLARQSLDFWLEQRGDSHRETGWARFALGVAQLEAGEIVSAETELRLALDVARRNYRQTDSPVWFAQVEAALARCLTIRAKYGEAETLLSRAYERIEEYGKNQPRVRREIVGAFAALYSAWGKQPEMVKWQPTAD